MRLKEAYGRKVVSADDAESIGRVEAFVIHPHKRAVVGLPLAKARGDRPSCRDQHPQLRRHLGTAAREFIACKRVE